MKTIASKLDWNRMLGFEQIAGTRTAIAARSMKLGAKVGGKVGTKVGAKLGLKLGAKIGLKV